MKNSKSKTTALLLAIFLSFWTWVYTWKNDSEKFVAGILIAVLLCWTFIAPLGVWIWAMIDSTNTINKTEYYWE